MKPIDIQINQAQILSYAVELRQEDAPHINATIGLFSGNKRISTFRLCTQSFFSDSIQFDLPADMIGPIVEIAKQLEVILVRECQKQLKRLPAGDIIENEAQ